MKKLSLKKGIATLLIMAITLTTFTSTQVFAADKTNRNFTWQAENGYEFTAEDITSILPVLETIDKIPTELLEKGTHEEINKFCQEHGTSLKIYNDNIGETSSDLHLRKKRKSAWRCSLAIGQLIVTVGIPATKITKIKKYISALGGVRKTAKLLVGATSVSEKARGLLTSLGSVLMTITGIDGIKEHCFG